MLGDRNIESNGKYWEECQFGSPQVEQDPSLVDVTPSMVGNKRSRTENFNQNEDNMLVAAWINIIRDPKQRNEQSKPTYWQRVHDCYHQHKDFESDRSSDSLMQRWSTILESVNMFCGYYTQIQYRRQRGLTEQDKIMQACEMYKAMDKNNESFSLLHC